MKPPLKVGLVESCWIAGAKNVNADGMDSAETAPAIKKQPLPWHEGQLHVLRALHFAGRSSRGELATQTGLSPQSLTRIAHELLSTGYIQELERRRTGTKGQPAIELQLTPGRILSLGLVLEYDRITCVLRDLADGVLRRSEIAGEFRSAERSVVAAERLVAQMLTALPAGGILLGIGISQSGFFFAPATQQIVAQGDIEGWTKTDLGSRLSERFKLDVFIENDGRAAATGHLVHGVGTAFDNFFVVLLTRGIGGGGVVDRRLIRGRLGNAGEMAMLVPKRDAIRPTIDSLSRHLDLVYDDVTFDETIQALLREGDPRLMEWIDTCAAILTTALTSVCALVDPEAVILSGRMPIVIRSALAERISLSGPSIAGVSPPAPSIIVDPAADCLEVGAAALPIARLFSGLSRRVS